MSKIMYKNFRTVETVMETRDHLSNGDNLKTPKSKRSFLFVATLILALCSVFVACSDDKDELEDMKKQLEAEQNKTATDVKIEGDKMIITFSNGTSTTTSIPNGIQGPQGETGNGIENITYNQDTSVLTITMTNGNVSNFAIFDNKVQLPEHIIGRGSSSGYFKLEYDDQNRIKQIYENSSSYYTFTYSGDDLVKIVEKGYYDDQEYSTTEFVKNGNKITFIMYDNYNNDDIKYTGTIDLDNDGYPTKLEGISNYGKKAFTFQFQEGNLIKLTETDTEYIKNYKYDNKKSPLYNCKTPKWYFFLNFIDAYFHSYIGYYTSFGCQNNIIEIMSFDDSNGVFFDYYKEEFRYRYDNAGYPINVQEIEKNNSIEFFYK